MSETTKTNLSYLINVPKINDEGFLCFIEEDNHIPFEIKRIYYIFDVIKNAVRGRHSHKETKQFLFCLKGNVTVILDNGKEKETIKLNKPDQGLFLDSMMWHEMIDFEKDTLLMVIASDFYKEDDYIRDYQQFLKEVSK